MFELIFGIVWTVFSLVFVFAFFGGGSGITGDMIGPALFIGLFVIIGIAMICIGLKKVLTNAKTASNGRETYGLIIAIYPSGSRVNGRPIMNADVLVVEEDGSVGRYTESIGMKHFKYRIGSFVKVKHYEQDINILDTSEAHVVPYHIKDKLDAEFEAIRPHIDRYEIDGVEAADTVVINGVEYERKKK